MMDPHVPAGRVPGPAESESDVRQRSSMIHNPTDRALVTLALAAFLGASILVLPIAEYPHVLGRFAATALVTWIVAPRLPFEGPLGLEVLLVTFCAIGILVFPTTPVYGGRGGSDALLSLVGAQVIVLLWTCLRWGQRPAPRQGVRHSLREALFFGCLMAAGLSLIATIPIGLVALSSWQEARILFWVYPAYFGGGAAAALMFWLLQDIRHSASGRYVIGVVCGFFVYIAVAPIVAVLRDEPMLSGTMLLVGYVCGAVVGSAISVSWETAI